MTNSLLQRLLEATRGASLALKGADFSGADLEGADLSGLCLDNANFQGCSLRNANLDYATLRGARLDGVDATGASLQHVVADKCSALGMNLQNANIGLSRWLDAKLDASVFSEGWGPTYVDFRFASLRGVMMRGVEAKCVSMWGAHLDGATMCDVEAHYWDLRVSSAKGTDWRGATFSDCALGTELCDGRLDAVKWFSNGSFGDDSNTVVHANARIQSLIVAGLQISDHDSRQDLAVLKLPLASDANLIESLAKIVDGKLVAGHKNHVLVVDRRFLRGLTT